MTRKLPVGPLLFSLGLFLSLDLAAAQLCQHLLLAWNPWKWERRFRVPSALYDHDLAPNVIADATWGPVRYTYRTNSLGFRDDTVRTISLRAGHRRVLFLGDSFTEGLGLPYPETFVGIVAREAARRGVEVLNAGVTSYSPVIYYRKAKHYIEEERLQVDAVVVAVDVSDVYDEVMQYRLGPDDRVYGPPVARPIGRRVAAWLRDNSLLGHVLALALLAVERRSPRKALGLDEEKSAWEVDERAFRTYGEQGLRLARDHMGRLLQLTRAHHIPLAIIIYPWPDEIARGDRNTRQATSWTEWARSNAVPLLDLFPLFVSPGDPAAMIRRYFVPYDVHWNAAGNRLVGEAVLNGPLGPLFRTGRRGP